MKKSGKLKVRACSNCRHTGKCNQEYYFSKEKIFTCPDFREKGKPL